MDGAFRAVFGCHVCRSEGGAPGAAEEEADEEEPEWELPEHLREYEGDPTDRKAMLSFRQAQQAARQARS